MNWFTSELNTIAEAQTAGIKARDDVDKILKDMGYSPLKVVIDADRHNLNTFNKLFVHFKLCSVWDRALSKAKKGDTVVMQFPVINHTVLLDAAVKKLKHRGVRIIALVHDLEILRLSLVTDVSPVKRWRLKREELSVLKLFDKIIVHNTKMIDYVTKVLDIPSERLINLGIFDYLAPDITIQRYDMQNFRSVIIAGNLSETKSKYVYDLPDTCNYQLYGPNFTGKTGDNICYNGSFPPEQLPSVLKGGFGLVWDGTSAKTCDGVLGEYLRYNNPHKTSLYLASGIPVIIWDKAALADFVKQNCCGITVESLYDIPKTLDSLSESEYKKMCDCTAVIGKRLRDGYYTKKAVGEIK